MCTYIVLVCSSGVKTRDTKDEDGGKKTKNVLKNLLPPTLGGDRRHRLDAAAELCAPTILFNTCVSPINRDRRARARVGDARGIESIKTLQSHSFGRWRIRCCTVLTLYLEEKRSHGSACFLLFRTTAVFNLTCYYNNVVCAWERNSVYTSIYAHMCSTRQPPPPRRSVSLRVCRRPAAIPMCYIRKIFGY